MPVLKIAPPLPNAFYLAWGAPQIVAGSENCAAPLIKMECRIGYRAAGTLACGVDRGCALAGLDAELLRLLMPPRTAKLDCAQTPATAQGTFVFWGTPEFEDAKPAAAAAGFARAGEQDALTRKARLAVFYFPEVQA